MESNIVHRVVLPLVFPQGLRPGAGKADGNLLAVAIDGMGRPILRGTALTGALRHAYARAHGVPSGDPFVSEWFGQRCDERNKVREGEPSALRVSDVVLDGDRESVQLRHHNSIDRHSGAVRKGGLFDLQSLPPGVSGRAVLELARDKDDASRVFLGEIVAMFRRGIILGGSGARGIGRAELASRARHRRFDLNKLEEHATFLDERYDIRGGKVPADGDDLVTDVDDGVLRIHLELAVPRGQDLLVGDGQALDHEIEPQRVIDAKGKLHWRLPGSALRGVFRAWVTRLAAREPDAAADAVADNITRFRKEGSAKGAAWLFHDADTREKIIKGLETEPEQLDRLVECPVSRLFGSSYARGKVHIADSLVPFQADDEQPRSHVAVDRITGGANEGFYFENTVLTSSPHLRFPVTIQIDRPTKQESKWFAKTIDALDRGILRIGSSKSGGRLALTKPPKATGDFAEIFEALQPSGAQHV